MRVVLYVGFLIYSLIFITLSTNVNAATYYISPNGSDSNGGTSSSTPWQTFSFAIPRLNPGDTLFLLNGTYTSGNSGRPQITCGSNANNGTASQPITMKAQNERQAHIQGDGTSVMIYILRCSYWVIEGIYASNVDNTNASSNGDSTVLVADSSDHITLRRNLVYHPNRWHNSGLLSLYYSSY